MENKEQHFKPIFYFIVGLCFCILTYIFMVTFLIIPKDNIRFADGALGFLLGILSAAVAYLVGGNPNASKKTDIVTDKNVINEQPTTPNDQH